jgi:hypothetical protein
VTATTNDTTTSTAPTEITGVPVATPAAGIANTGVQIYAPTLAYYKNNSEKLKNINQQKKRTPYISGSALAKHFYGQCTSETLLWSDCSFASG